MDVAVFFSCQKLCLGKIEKLGFKIQKIRFHLRFKGSSFFIERIADIKKLVQGGGMIFFNRLCQFGCGKFFKIFKQRKTDGFYISEPVHGFYHG